LFNSKLAAIVASDASSMRPDGAGADYMKGALYDDALTAFDAAGRYAADKFGVSNAVVLSRTPFPASTAGLQIPVAFERRGDEWHITNRVK
jgi:hypothetical protein